MAGIHTIARQCGLRDQQVIDVFVAITARVFSGESVVIRNFGTFFLYKRKGYKVVFPRGPAVIPAYQRLKLRAAKQMRQRIVGGSNVQSGKASRLYHVSRKSRLPQRPQKARKP